MKVIPAIDLKDGQCVRLKKGDYDTVHKVAEDPVETARKFMAAGATMIHMVDLDAARTARTRITVWLSASSARPAQRSS